MPKDKATGKPLMTPEEEMSPIRLGRKGLKRNMGKRKKKRGGKRE